MQARSDQTHTVNGAEPGRHAAFLAFPSFGAKQPAGLEIRQHGRASSSSSSMLVPVLPPETHTEDAQLADDVARGADVAVAENGVAQRRRLDEFHEDVGAPLALVGAEGGEEGRDLRAVDVVAAALALRLEHVGGGARGIRGERFGVLARGGAVERVDGGEGSADAGQKGGVGRKEAFEMGGRGRGECLLDFLRPGQVGEDGGAFDRGAPFEMGA